jgi:hypothetical protein
MSEHLVLKNTISMPSPNARFPLWVQVVVEIGVILLTAGGVISLLHPALLVSPHDEINPAVRVHAAYTFARDLALAFMLFTALLLRTRTTLNSLMVLTGFIQLLDALRTY